MKKILLFLLLIAQAAVGQQVERPLVKADRLQGLPASSFWSKPDTGANGKLAGYYSTIQALATKWALSDTTSTLETKTYNNSKLGLKVNKANWDGETTHSTFTSAPLLSVTTQQGYNEAVDQYITNYRTSYQGLAWNEVTDTYARLGSLSGLATSVSPGNGNLPVQGKMRGCLLKDDGTVNYYLNAYDWAYKEDGTASTLTGADGQVMVQIPAFYIKYEKYGNWHAWYISLYPLTGYTLHPAFTKDGVNVAYRYIGAYEGILYDNSASLYANGLYLPADTVTFASADSTITIEGSFPTNGFTSLAAGDKIKITGTTSNNSTFTVKTIGDKHIHVVEVPTNETSNAAVIQNERDYTATTGDKLCSVSGKVPITYLRMGNSRVLATNVGAGWRQLDYDLVNALEWLILTEYGTFYIQNIPEIGPGITNITGWDKYSNYNPFATSGNGNGIGNATGDNAGNVAVGTEKTKYLRYRGIENFYGHIYKWVDGININANVPYVTNNSAAWANGTSTGYTNTGVTLASSNGYASTLVNSSRVMLPSAVTGAAGTFITDNYYPSTGWRVAAFGGDADDGANAGTWYWFLYYDSGLASQKFGARLAF